MSQKNGKRGRDPNRSSATAQARFSFLSSAVRARRIRLAAYRANMTLSDVINWCIDQAIRQYPKRGPRLDPGEHLRPGVKIRVGPGRRR